MRCGLVFKTKATTNRREEQKHGEPLPEEDIRQDESQEDYKLNYHSAKLTFGLVLFEFNDAVKEGDIC